MDTNGLQPDIAQAVEAMSYRFGIKKEAKLLPERLQPGERVLRLAAGNCKGGAGLIVLTDRRVIVYAESWGHKAFEAVELTRIASVSFSQTRAWGRMHVNASGTTLEVERMNPTDGRHFADAVDAQRMGHGVEASGPVSQQPAPAAAPVTAGPVDPLALLAQLRQLRDAGRLSSEAFGPVAAELSQM